MENLENDQEIQKKSFHLFEEHLSQNWKNENSYSLVLLFSVKKKFRKANIQFSSRRFFFFVVEMPMTRRVHKSAESLLFCIIHVSGFTPAEKPEVEGSNPAAGHNF